ILLQFLCSKDAQTILDCADPQRDPAPQGRNGYQLPPPAHPFSTSRSTMSKIHPDHDRSSSGEPG
ncbi:hypothetical protein, partial [Azospirillum melinis]|uniref:hypothetical protein n=1 Tax=Azospirillum melinis TaxID=328839 RepID=UPI001B3BF732